MIFILWFCKLTSVEARSFDLVSQVPPVTSSTWAFVKTHNRLSSIRYHDIKVFQHYECLGSKKASNKGSFQCTEVKVVQWNVQFILVICRNSKQIIHNQQTSLSAPLHSPAGHLHPCKPHKRERIVLPSTVWEPSPFRQPAGTRWPGLLCSYHRSPRSPPH